MEGYETGTTSDSGIEIITASAFPCAADPPGPVDLRERVRRRRA